jgi:hypothetical protein
MAIIHPSRGGHREALGIRAAAIAATLALVAAVPAMAAAPKLAGGPYCAVGLAQPAGGGPAIIKSEQCFGTFAEAMAVSTGGRAVLGPDFAPADLTADLVGVPAAASEDVVALSRWTLGNDFKDPHYLGQMRTYFVDGVNPPCANGVKWHIDNLDMGWGNSISSAQGFSGCNHFQHFDLPNRQGQQIMCPPNCWSMPGMDNKTESLLWFA